MCNTPPRNCECHGEPCYWQKDARKKNGGWWECRVKRQQYNRTRSTNAARREAICQRRRDRYDNDPVFRIGKRLRDDAAARQSRLAKRKAKLLKEGSTWRATEVRTRLTSPGTASGDAQPGS